MFMMVYKALHLIARTASIITAAKTSMTDLMNTPMFSCGIQHDAEELSCQSSWSVKSSGCRYQYS